MARLDKKRKIPGEANGYWLPHWDVTNNTAITEGPLKSPLGYPARRELVERMSPAYREASRAQKMLLLDTFVALTGYVGKYAMWLLNHPVESRYHLNNSGQENRLSSRSRIVVTEMVSWGKGSGTPCGSGQRGNVMVE